MRIIKLTEKIEAILAEHRQIFTDSLYRNLLVGRRKVTRQAFDSAVALGVSRGSIRRIDGGVILEVRDDRRRDRDFRSGADRPGSDLRCA